ncbi:MAG: hypothetical protein HOP06_11915 [Methylotenera sp.]|nr:hypothetical protein [Methylotenera sp.]
MKLVCPCCQAEFPLAAAMNDVAARQAVARAFKFTPFGDLLLAYIALFKPAQRALSMMRLTKMLDELLEDIQNAEITRNGNTYAAPQGYWQQAIEQMLMSRDNLSLPLKSHGYLYEIIISYSNKAEAKAEKQSEQGRKYGNFHTAETKPVNHIVKAGEMVKTEKSVMPQNVKDTLKKRNW